MESLSNLKPDQAESKIDNFNPTPSPLTFIFEIYNLSYRFINLNVAIATKVVCFFRLLKCLRSLYGKQYGPRSDCE